MAHSISNDRSDEVPPVEELNSLLDELSEEGDPEGAELEEAETELSAEEEFLALDESEAGSLELLLAIASQYPGLKITLSF